MQTVSAALANAIESGNPQRALLVFSDGTEFTNEDILMSAGITLQESVNAATDLSIGQCPSAELRFSLWNRASELENFAFGEFTACLGARIDSGTPTELTRQYTEGGSLRTYAFAPLGTFIAEKPSVLRKATIAVTAYDRMSLFDKEMPTAAQLGLTAPYTAANILTKMCQYLNLTAPATNFLNSGASLAGWPEKFEGATMREVLGYIAEVACSNARFNREGRLELVWYSNTPVATFGEGDQSDIELSWYETAAIDGLHIRNEDSTEETTCGTTGGNEYMIQGNPFLRPDEVVTTSG